MAAIEPEILSSNLFGSSLELNEFEIEEYLKPNHDEQDTLFLNIFLFSTQHNKNIDINIHNQHEIELNLSRYEKMTHFDGILHSKHIEQITSYSPCISAIETIEFDPNDWSKILEDKRKPPRTATGSTAVLPLFIPREQRSVTYKVENDYNSNKRLQTNKVRKDILQKLSAPNLHKMNEPPLYKQYEQKINGKIPETKDKENKMDEIEINEQHKNEINEEHKNEINEEKVDQKAVDDIIKSTIDDMDDIRAQRVAENGGNHINDDEFISYVTDLIVQKISNQTNKDKKDEKKVEKESKKELSVNTAELIGNEPLTHGARANQTSIGSALLSIKMSGLKQRLTPSATATASIDPYNTNQPHSTLIANEKFGPNVVTPARPPSQSALIPEVINGNTESYKFQSVQQQQQQPMYVPMMIPTPINPINYQPINTMYYPSPYNFNYIPAPFISPINAQNIQPMNTQNIQQKNDKIKEYENAEISDDALSISSKKSKRGRKSKKNKENKGNEEDRNAAEIKDLFTKAINNRYNAVEELLASNMNPNTKDEHGNTVLHVAAQNGNKRLIKVALRWGANINEQNKQGQTALHYLFAYKYENLAAYLISKGADDTIQNEFGYTCYDGLRPSGDT